MCIEENDIVRKPQAQEAKPTDKPNRKNRKESIKIGGGAKRRAASTVHKPYDDIGSLKFPYSPYPVRSFCFVLSIDHSPWNGCMLADFVTPFFLFIVEVAFALTLKILETIASLKTLLRKPSGKNIAKEKSTICFQLPRMDTSLDFLEASCKSRKTSFMILELSNKNQSAESNDSIISTLKNTQEHMKITQEHSRIYAKYMKITQEYMKNTQEHEEHSRT
ncbi:hypothetical protein LXL04_039300 [Taraxacum kok-saghyz]